MVLDVKETLFFEAPKVLFVPCGVTPHPTALRSPTRRQLKVRASSTRKGRRNTLSRLAKSRAVEGLGGAPGLRPEWMYVYRFDEGRRPARRVGHELGAGAVLCGYPRRP